MGGGGGGVGGGGVGGGGVRGESWKIFFFFNMCLRLMAETYNVLLK